jgi:hypothetical protein
MTAFPLPGRRALAPAATHRGRWATRAVVALAVVAVTVLGAGATAANAAFSDSAALASLSVGTVTVAPVTDVRVNSGCVTRTTVTKRTYKYHPATGTSTLTGYSQTSSSTASMTDVQSATTTTTWFNRTEYTTTQTVKDTQLYATLRWTPSTATRVSGYRMTAHTTTGKFPMGESGPAATSMTVWYDASLTTRSPRLSVDTLTDYGWTGTSALSDVVTC